MDEDRDTTWDDEEALDVPLDPAVTKKLFRQWRAPRYGKTNPERMNNPVWEWMVRSRTTPYAVAQRFGEPSPLEAGAGWCFYRFGRTGTELPDRRTVLIAGEHEDCYDPDFYIYNDVVVLHPDAHMDIFGYPREVFPPTDFHTATLVGNRIFIIGGLNYPEERQPGVTNVFCLDLESFAVAPFATTGKPPGWIHRHTAALSVDGSAIRLSGGRINSVKNINEWELRLASGSWEQLTARLWQIWQVQREDNHLTHLWQIRSQLSLEAAGQKEAVAEQMRKLWEQHGLANVIPTLEQEIGGPPDVDALNQLYRPPVPHARLPGAEEPNTCRICADGVTVRYEESLHGIEIMFEGALPQKTINAVVRDVQAKLARLERAACKAGRCSGETGPT